MSNRYETVFIISPRLSVDEDKNKVNKFRKVLKDMGATIVHEEHWGLKDPLVKNPPGSPQLAEFLNDQKNAAGKYHLFEFITLDPKAVSELELSFKRDEAVLRFLTVRLD